MSAEQKDNEFKVGHYVVEVVNVKIRNWVLLSSLKQKINKLSQSCYLTGNLDFLNHGKVRKLAMRDAYAEAADISWYLAQLYLSVRDVWLAGLR